MKKKIILVLITLVAFSCKKEESKPAELNNISIKTSPSKPDYYIGEALDFSGLVVTLTMDNGITKDVAFADFGSNSLSCSPENGTQANSSSKLITITHTTSGKSANFEIIVDKLKDARDNQIYKFVKIGNQVWMAENLRYKTASGSWYYMNDSATYAKPYGRFYLWDVAMQGASSSSSNPSNVKGACPEGWHFSSDAEWAELKDYIYSNRYTNKDLMDTCKAFWDGYSEGTNRTGFSATLTGTMYNNGTQSVNITAYSTYISSTLSPNISQGITSYRIDTDTIRSTVLGRTNAWCVRCVQDQIK
jgi:uncharacterized protein (TIGR02145 family)